VGVAETNLIRLNKDMENDLKTSTRDFNRIGDLKPNSFDDVFGSLDFDKVY
jgi:hypothetical protein